MEADTAGMSFALVFFAKFRPVMIVSRGVIVSAKYDHW